VDLLDIDKFFACFLRTIFGTRKKEGRFHFALTLLLQRTNMFGTHLKKNCCKFDIAPKIKVLENYCFNELCFIAVTKRAKFSKIINFTEVFFFCN
jgi:hypothetical protein